jgi:hypothetical protein
MMDVMLKDILGNRHAAGSSEALTSLPADRVDAAAREAIVVKVHKKMLRVYPLIVLGLLGSLVPGLRTTAQDIETYRQGIGGWELFRAYLNGFDTVNTIAYVVAGLELSVGVTTLCLAASLHRAHICCFVSWLEQHRRLAVDQDERDGDGGISDPLAFRQLMESYLLINSLLKRSSAAWGFGLSVWITITGGLFILGVLAALVVADQTKATCLAIAVLCFVICIVPIIILAYANSFVDLLVEASGPDEGGGGHHDRRRDRHSCCRGEPHQHQILFVRQQRLTHASWTDYASIGGREKWLRYISEHPPYWFVFGKGFITAPAPCLRRGRAERPLRAGSCLGAG